MGSSNNCILAKWLLGPIVGMWTETCCQFGVNTMQTTIQAHGVELTESIKRQAYEKLDLALDHFEEEIVRVSILIIDVNGPLLGGVDKAIRIVVQLRNQDALIVEDLAETVDQAVEHSTDRLGVLACQRAEILGRTRRPSSWLRWSDES
jgi:ribosome-associated translation inhibitor RaiA